MSDLARRALACLDLTSLNDGDDAAAIEKLCARAQTKHGNVAAVCLWPKFVAQAKAALAGSGVKIATVVNFPSGMEPAADVVAMTKSALADGADEIDLVFPYIRWLRGEKVPAVTVVARVREACGKATLKVIVESGAFPALDKLDRACSEIVEAGADFLKTSTGKSEKGATPDAAHALLQVAARNSYRDVGVKISGGVRTLSDAATYLDLADAIRGPDWVSPATFRFGASGLLDALLADLDGTAAPTPGKGY